MKFSLTADAEHDIKEITKFIAEDSPQTALEFFDELTGICNRLAEMPLMAQAVPEYIRETAPILSDCRRWPMKRFSSYLIFYKPEKDHILVLRVLNGKRDLPVLFNEWEY